jgi:hypothetical protein
MTLQLAWGLKNVIPEDAPTAWGARLIFPDDLLWDRQDFYKMDTDEGRQLKAWLDGAQRGKGALYHALRNARALADSYQLRSRDAENVTLYEDTYGIIQGNPRGSSGYLYVAAWPKAG